MLINDPGGFWERDFAEPLLHVNNDVLPQRFTDIDCSLSYIADHEPLTDHHSTPGESAGLAGSHS